MLLKISKFGIVPLLVLLFSIVGVSAQTAPISEDNANTSSSLPAPWLITVIHQISAVELQRVMAQRGVKDLTPFQMRPINITTGIVVDREGRILTRLVNLNPESGADGIGDISVVLANGERRTAKFIGFDGPSGFSLISVDNLNIEPSRIADAKSINAGLDAVLLNVYFKPILRVPPNNRTKPMPNQNAIAIASFKRELLTQQGKLISLAQPPMINFQLTGANQRVAIPGVGLLINRSGEVIGIPDAIQVGNTLTAFSASEAQKAINRILARGGNVPRAWLGIDTRNFASLPIQKANELALPERRGVFVNQVLPDSPAEQAGIKEGDVIVAVNGDPAISKEQLSSFISLQPAGEVVEFTYWRSKKLDKIKVTLGDRGYNTALKPDEVGASARVYVTKKEITSIEKSLIDVQTQLDKLRKPQPDDTNSNDNTAVSPEIKNLIDEKKRLEAERDSLNRKLIPRRGILLQDNIEQKWLGIIVEDLPSTPFDPAHRTPRPRGVQVKEVQPNSLAARAGVQPGDVLTKISIYNIGNQNVFTKILSILRQAHLKDCALELTRGTESINLKLDVSAPVENSPVIPLNR